MAMRNKESWGWIFACTACFFLNSAGAQINDFPLVQVIDTPANISGTAQKVYTTTIRLTPTLGSSRFVEATFIESMQTYYSEAFTGFVTMSVLESSAVPGTGGDLRIRYEVRYNYVLMLAAGATDALVSTTIGNRAQIKANLESNGEPLNVFYRFADDASSFAFTGSVMCSGDVCPANTVCNETLAGVTVVCVSQCKLGHCFNNGTCAQASTAVTPSCSCLSRSDVWFLGARCQAMVELWMVILVGVGSFLIILASIVLACCCYHSKRRRKEKEAMMAMRIGVENSAYVNEPPIREKEVIAPRREADEKRYVRSRRRSSTPRSSSRRHTTDSFDDDSSDSSDEGELTIPTRSDDRKPPSVRSSSAASSSATSSEHNEVELVEHGTSPIRWTKPKPAQDDLSKIDIATRRGWKPSLGPQMFDIGSRDDLDAGSSSDDDENDVTAGSARFADTDI